MTMSGANLFLPICGPLFGLFIVVIAVLGTRARLAFAHRISEAMKNDRTAARMRSDVYRRKQRLLLGTALGSLLGSMILMLLLWTHTAALSTPVLVGLGTFVILTITSGSLLLIDIENLTK